jgi:hypothetical protein
MKIRILSTKEAPSIFRRFMGQVLNGPAQAIPVRRSQVPYWQESGWKQAGRNYMGTYKTSFGSFVGMIEEIRPGNYRLYIYDPPRELKSHGHWACFQRLDDRSYRIHMSKMPRDVSAAIITIERLLTEAFGGR